MRSHVEYQKIFFHKERGANYFIREVTLLPPLLTQLCSFNQFDLSPTHIPTKSLFWTPFSAFYMHAHSTDKASYAFRPMHIPHTYGEKQIKLSLSIGFDGKACLEPGLESI